VVLYVCSFINGDGMIADFNVRHCREIRGEGVPIDLEYLEGLGPEALPALLWLDKKLGNGPKTEAMFLPHRQAGQPALRLPGLPAYAAKEALNKTVWQLQQQLHDNLKNWRGWTLRRQRLAGLGTPKEGATPDNPLKR